MNIAMSHANGTLLTISIIVVLVIVLGVIVITDDIDWFD
jgi:hypothetical protein